MVVGNMVGSGIFLLPASLALYGGIAMVGWIIAALGAVLLASLFGSLGQYAPSSIGGPYVYTKIAFGEFAAFLVAWGYWIAIWITNAAIAVACVGYLKVFFPILGLHPIVSVAAGLCIIWGFSWINTRRLQTIASVQVITTIIKIIPIFLVGFFGIFYIDWSHLKPLNLSSYSNFQAITATVTLTIFAFQGMESAGILSGDTKDAASVVRKSTVLGTFITIVIYLMSSLAIMGIVDAATLAESTAPFAEAAKTFWGPRAEYIIAFCAVVATTGALNGWILLQGRIPMTAANDHLFPSLFGRLNARGAPVIGIIISSLLASILLGINFSKSLVETFTFMIMLSTLSVLVPYLFSAASLTIIRYKQGQRKISKEILVAIAAFIFSIWIIVGCGAEIVFYGFLLLILGIPFYVLLRIKSM